MKTLIIIIFFSIASVNEMICQTYIAAHVIMSCDYGPTGSIVVDIIAQDMQPDWLPPYSLEAINTTTGQAYSAVSVGYQAVFHPVPAGGYSITLYLGDKCEIIFEVEVGSIPTTAILAKIMKTNAYCGLDNGTARTTPLSGGDPPYNFQWSNGETTHEIQNLPPGYYCVTVTDQECGYAVRCVLVEEEEIPTLQLQSFHHLAMCEGSGSQEPCTGFIDMELIAVSGYTCTWTGPNGFTSAQLDLSGLCDPGLYQLQVALQPGCPNLNFSLNLCCCQDPNSGSPHLCQSEGSNQELEAEGLVIPAFEGNNGSILLEVSGGFGSYTWIAWEGPAGYEGFGSAIYQLAGGIYHVTISDGCQEIIQSYEVSELDCNRAYSDLELAEIFLVQITRACVSAGEGSLVIAIPNVPGYPPQLHVNGIGPLTLILDRNVFYFPIYNISGDESLEISIGLGNCDFEFSYQIPVVPLIEVYSHIQDLICYYDQYCYGNFIGTIEQPAYIDVPNGDYIGLGIPGLPNGCNVPVLCQGEQVTEIQMDLIKVTNAEYQAILNAFADAGIISGDVFNWLMTLLDRRDLDLCDNVWYCPGDLSIAYQELFADLDYGDYPWLPTEDPDCFIIPCIPPEIICLYDLDIPDIYLDNYFSDNPPQPCHGVTQTFIQLLYWHQSGFLNSHSGYLGSELEAFIVQHMNNEPSVCAKVRYCCNTFNFLYSDIGQVSCGVYFPHPLNVTCNYIENAQGYIQYALCCADEPFCNNYYNNICSFSQNVDVCSIPTGVALQDSFPILEWRSYESDHYSHEMLNQGQQSVSASEDCRFNIYPTVVDFGIVLDGNLATVERMDIYSMDMRRITSVGIGREPQQSIIFPELSSGIYFLIFIGEDNAIICKKSIYYDH